MPSLLFGQWSIHRNPAFRKKLFVCAVAVYWFLMVALMGALLSIEVSSHACNGCFLFVGRASCTLPGEGSSLGSSSRVARQLPQTLLKDLRVLTPLSRDSSVGEKYSAWPNHGRGNHLLPFQQCLLVCGIEKVEYSSSVLSLQGVGYVERYADHVSSWRSHVMGLALVTDSLI
eukprot:6491092-Amphidinium_carterae.8